MLLPLSTTAPKALPERPAGQRPELMLLTSLPIIFPERLSLESAGSPALDALQSRYRVVPISVSAASELGDRKLLLMAQPQAQPAEALVDLDGWVRGGGRLLLLADPALAWPSELPLGHRLRPPLAFADTGLLGHWGLRLDPPDSLGPARRAVGGFRVRTVSPGKLDSTGSACTTSDDGLIGRCLLGRGRATVIADSDFLNPGEAESARRESGLGLLLAELERLEK